MQDSVLPRGVGLRKPHIFSFPLTPFSFLLTHSFLLTSHSLLFTSHSSLLFLREGVGG